MDTIHQWLEGLSSIHPTKEKPFSFKWHNTYDFLLANAKGMAPVALAKRLGPMKKCYATAATTALNQYGSDHLVYCEGYAIPDGLFPMDHAWLYDISENKVIETTWTKPGLDYFGIAFKTEFLRKSLLNRKYFGLIGNWEDEFPLLRMTKKQLSKVMHPMMKR